jgi:hypothetical protein
MAQSQPAIRSCEITARCSDTSAQRQASISVVGAPLAAPAGVNTPQIHPQPGPMRHPGVSRPSVSRPTEERYEKSCLASSARQFVDCSPSHVGTQPRNAGCQPAPFPGSAALPPIHRATRIRLAPRCHSPVESHENRRQAAGVTDAVLPPKCAQSSIDARRTPRPKSPASPNSGAGQPPARHPD